MLTKLLPSIENIFATDCYIKVHNQTMEYVGEVLLDLVFVAVGTVAMDSISPPSENQVVIELKEQFKDANSIST